MKSRRTTGTAGRLFATALATLGALTLVALVAGCGDGDDSSSTTASVPTGELSATELASAADDICADWAQVKPDAPVPDFSSPPTEDEIRASAEFWGETADQGQDLLDQLSQLQPPADLQKQYDEFLKDVQAAQVDFAETLQKNAETADREKFLRDALDSQKSLTDLAASAQGLGMTVCGASDTSQSSSDS